MLTLADHTPVTRSVSLRWNHPLAFLVFAIVGGGGIALGVLLYLYWLLFRREASS